MNEDKKNKNTNEAGFMISFIFPFGWKVVVIITTVFLGMNKFNGILIYILA